MASASVESHILRAKQKLHRAELALARLKTKSNKARRDDARKKLLLGNLVFLVGWEKKTIEELDSRVHLMKTEIKLNNAKDEFQIKGQNALNLIPIKEQKYGNTVGMTGDQIRELNHLKITIGGLFVKYELDGLNRAILYGAILDFDEKQQKGKNRRLRVTT